MATGGIRLKTQTLMVIATIATGCLAGPASTPPDENPRFDAWFVRPPTFAYVEDGLTLRVAVKNVEPKKEVRTPGGGVGYIGEAGTHPVCLILNGQPLQCQEVSLIPGETKDISLRASPANLTPGLHEFRVRNASLSIDVRPMPRVGDWINGTLVDLRVVNGTRNTTDERKDTGMPNWNFTVQARFHNATQEVRVGFQFPQGGGFGVPWAEGVVTVTQQHWKFGPIPLGRPFFVVAGEVAAVERISDTDTTSHPVDRELFRWLVTLP